MMLINIERQAFIANAAADLTPLPGESITSSLWRFAWRNSLRAKELLRFCSRGASYEREHAKSTRAPGFDAKLFADSSRWARVSEEPKFIAAKRRHHLGMWWGENFRYCPICLEHVYHSFWHQNLFITHCPLDGAALSTECYCCGRVLPAYGFHHRLLDRPYTCEHCGGPIAGVEPQVSARLQIQEREKQMGAALAAFALWWELTSTAREEFEFLFGERHFYSYAPWLGSGTSIRQWVLDRAPVCNYPAVSSRTIPELIILKWRVRLVPPDPLERFMRTRIPRDVQLDLARQVYQTTLRRLERAIQVISPFDDAEHRRYLGLPPSDLVRHPSGCNMYLLAMVVLRRCYETYFSVMQEDISDVQFQMDLGAFGRELEFGNRVRIYWRLRFLAEYGSIYWYLVALRKNSPAAKRAHLSHTLLRSTKVDPTDQQGDLVTGSVAFPSVDGLDLRKLTGRKIE
jgi:hypothetical protein